MHTNFTGKAYVLGDNVDTDQIIPAQYLTFNPAIPEEYREFGKYALSSVPPAQAGLPKGHIPFHTDDEFRSPYKIIVAGRNHCPQDIEETVAAAHPVLVDARNLFDPAELAAAGFWQYPIGRPSSPEPIDRPMATAADVSAAAEGSLEPEAAWS